MESRPPRAAHPDRPSCVAVSVRPSSRQARRTAPPVFNGVNALAFGTLFSSQGASADPKEGTPKRWGRATHHGRHVSVRRQPRPVTRPRTPPARHDDSRNPSRRGAVAFDRSGQVIPNSMPRRGPIRSESRGDARPPRYPSRMNPRRPTWSTRPLSSLAGTSSAFASTACPSSRTPPCSISRRAWEFESASPRTARSLGR